MSVSTAILIPKCLTLPGFQGFQAMEYGNVPSFDIFGNQLNHTSTMFGKSTCLYNRRSDHSEKWKWKSLSRVQLFVTPWTWTIWSMEFSRPEYWGVGSLTLLQGIFPTQGSNPGWILCQLNHKGKPKNTGMGSLSLFPSSIPGFGRSAGEKNRLSLWISVGFLCKNSFSACYST